MPRRANWCTVDPAVNCSTVHIKKHMIIKNYTLFFQINFESHAHLYIVTSKNATAAEMFYGLKLFHSHSMLLSDERIKGGKKLQSVTSFMPFLPSSLVQAAGGLGIEKEESCHYVLLNRLGGKPVRVDHFLDHK